MANEPLAYGRYYHIYNRGNNGENLFVEPRNYPYFLQQYAKHIRPVAATYAYCLLPNHFHLLIRTYTPEEQEAYHQSVQIGSISKIEPISETTPKIGSISKIDPISRAIFKQREPSRAFNNPFIAYSRALNKAVQRTGALFESPFGRKPIDNDSYLICLAVYIHRNPQRHGLTADFCDWSWSSYKAIISSQPIKLERDDVLTWFGGRDNFIEAHRNEVDQELIAPLKFD
jgi:putative transposase